MRLTCVMRTLMISLVLYRYYEPNAQDHFYTTNFNELGNGKLGWYLEGVQCYVVP